MSTVRRQLEELDLDLLFADGFDAALLGYVQQFNAHIALYDREKCLSILQSQGMGADGAEEYFEFNVVGAYVGPGTPAFATIFKGKHAR